MTRLRRFSSDVLRLESEIVRRGNALLRQIGE